MPTRLPTPIPAEGPPAGDRNPPGPAASEGLTGASTDPILCLHCGRTASNGISCEGACVADSGY